MRAVIQRVSSASVAVEGRRISSIGAGLLVLLAIERGDTESVVAAGAAKTAALRIFPDGDSGKMNLSVADLKGEALVVSQFTLAATIRRGRRPSFDSAAPPEEASALCDHFAACLTREGVRVSTGRFGAMMEVALVNDGPVTIWMESGPGGEIGP